MDTVQLVIADRQAERHPPLETRRQRGQERAIERPDLDRIRPVNRVHRRSGSATVRDPSGCKRPRAATLSPLCAGDRHRARRSRSTNGRRRSDPGPQSAARPDRRSLRAKTQSRRRTRAHRPARGPTDTPRIPTDGVRREAQAIRRRSDRCPKGRCRCCIPLPRAPKSGQPWQRNHPAFSMCTR